MLNGCIVLTNDIIILLHLDVEYSGICSIMFSIFNFGWCLVCLFASYILDSSIWVKKMQDLKNKMQESLARQM
jgi:hypothetical protein